MTREEMQKLLIDPGNGNEERAKCFALNALCEQLCDLEAAVRDLKPPPDPHRHDVPTRPHAVSGPAGDPGPF